FQYYEGAVEAPIYEDMLSARFAFLYQDRDGTMKNRCGDAPPFEGRATTLTRRLVPPWSICGESVLGSMGVAQPSPIPPGLPRWVNDRHNWAGRGTMLFEPTLETSFLFNAHGTHRNEDSRLGQSYGTNGIQCLYGVYSRCQPGNSGFYPQGYVVRNVLGGNQGSSGYLTPEVRHRLTEMVPCFNYGIAQADLDPSQRCPTNITNLQTPDGMALDIARSIVARELARDLDKRPWEGDFNRVGPTVNDTWG